MTTIPKIELLGGLVANWGDIKKKQEELLIDAYVGVRHPICTDFMYDKRWTSRAYRLDSPGYTQAFAALPW